MALHRIFTATVLLSLAEGQDHQAAPRGGPSESVEGAGLQVWLPIIIVVVVLPLLCCLNLQRKLPRRYGIGENVLVRRAGNRLNRQHKAVVTAVHKERRPLGPIGHADEMEFIYCMLDAVTCDHFRPRAYDVQYEAGGQDKAPEAWISPLPAGSEATLAAVVGGGVASIEPPVQTVDGNPVPEINSHASA